MEERTWSNVEGHVLDRQQRRVVDDDSDVLLVVAAAGSGKTTTMLGKIKYLIEEKKIKEEEILVLSFTRDTVKDFRQKLNKMSYENVSVYTFHQLALKLLNEKSFSIAPNNYLEYVVGEYLEGIIQEYPKLIRRLLIYFHQNPFFLKNYQKLKEQDCFKRKKREWITTIARLKAENIPKEELLFLAKKEKNWNSQFLLKFLYVLINEYEKELSSQGWIDFDDMILFAEKEIPKKEKIGYRYIIIDEYQDTSEIRFLLVKALKEKTKAHLVVVGDDFQSIYRFSGCKLELFTQFSLYFKNSKILKLENTYRNSQTLIDIAGKFILKNPRQIRKKLHSEKENIHPIEIIYYKNERETFRDFMEERWKEGKRKILILGRNNEDIYHVLSCDFEYQKEGRLLWKKEPNLELRYKTIHRSKGLEEEDVVVIHLENGKNCLPNKEKETKIIKKLIPTEDYYPYSEERRLFYVALTRTKNKVYLLASKKNPSLFVLELEKIMRREYRKKRKNMIY